MERSRDCPECGAELKAAARSCRACGWESKGARSQAPVDPDHGRCSWVAGLGRCRFPGALSRGTHGDAPFYCAWHFQEPDAMRGEEIVRQSRDWDGSAESYMAMRKARATTAETPPRASAESLAALSRILGVKAPNVQSEPGANG